MSDFPSRIIVIDDNPAIHDDFIKILTISNNAIQFSEFDKELFGENDPPHPKNALPEFDIDTASQGEEGVKKIKEALEEGNPFALAFVDIRMPPGIDGIETIKQIWEFDRDIQIVICTAYSDYSWEDTVQELGLTQNLLILKKPFDIAAVRQLAGALTQKWLTTKDSKQHTLSLNKLIDKHSNSLAQSMALLRVTIESSFDGILVNDLKGKIIDFNQQFVKILGIKESFLEKNGEKQLFKHILDQVEEPKAFNKMIDVLANKTDSSSRQVIKLKNKQVVECYSKPHHIGKKIIGRVWSFHDITEQSLLKEKLEYQATHDALTGLPNRTLLLDRIWQEITRATRQNTKFAVFFLDLDRFKFVNDTLGHEFGDQLLCLVSQRLLSTIRKIDTIARLGGDEFVLIFPSLTNSDQIAKIGLKLIKLFDKQFKISNHKIKIRASIGISIYPDDGNKVNTLLGYSDLAMYQAKTQGGHQFAFYTEELNKRIEYLFQMETELQHAIAYQEFFLIYQPQFAIDNQRVIATEALIRWQHPRRGVVLPHEFIGVAESSGLIVAIGEWVIKEACKQITEWHKKGLPLMKVAVNVASKQLRQANFPNMVKQIVTDYKLDSSLLEIEITENVIIDKEIQQNVLELKKLGFSIVLDDYGTGNSSLYTLKELQIDRLKIDQTFVKNISKSRGDEAIIEAIIAISHNMNFKVIAEGVETPTQIEFLKNKHCDEIQGYLRSKPLSVDEIEQLMKREQRLM